MWQLTCRMYKICTRHHLWRNIKHIQRSSRKWNWNHWTHTRHDDTTTETRKEKRSTRKHTTNHPALSAKKNTYHMHASQNMESYRKTYFNWPSGLSKWTWHHRTSILHQNSCRKSNYIFKLWTLPPTYWHVKSFWHGQQKNSLWTIRKHIISKWTPHHGNPDQRTQT